jgi:RNA polymerase sigma-70 factor (ECF subfamily)
MGPWEPSPANHKAARSEVPETNARPSIDYSSRPNAHAELFRAYAPQLYRKAYSLLRNREDAEDALQNSWLSVLANLHSFEGRSTISTWLTRIVINSSLMILRKNRKETRFPRDLTDTDTEANIMPQLQGDSADPEQILLESERRRVLDEAISRLRPRARAALELAQVNELSMKETARALGISLSAAKGRMFHAREVLRNSRALRTVARQ